MKLSKNTMNTSRPILAASLLIGSLFTNAQVVLEAQGNNSTYADINAILAPDGNVVEVPDCGHESFGDHIDEVFDNTLDKYVFRFYAHRDEDDDRCKNFDRQRTEIKTYDKSPDNLLGLVGEEVEYKWLFKLSSNFRPSSKFTHLHQIKAVGGSQDAMPLITLTARKGSPDKLELRYAAALDQSTIHEINLNDLKGEWVRATEVITYGEAGKGKYTINITRLSDDSVLMNYTNNALRMWKTDADFQRPKWGIYRSLLDASSLQDEEVLFADISITELTTISVPKFNEATYTVYPNPANTRLNLDKAIITDFEKYTLADIYGKVLTTGDVSRSIDVSSLPHGVYIMQLVNSQNATSVTKKILIQ